MSRKKHVVRAVLLFALLSLGFALPASAWVGVGASPGCEVRTLQEAVDRIVTRERNGDFHDPYIVVSGGTFITDVTINGQPAGTSRPIAMTITGGYAADCSGPESGATTQISANGRGRSVLTIRNFVDVSLENIQLIAGFSDGNGGGIDIEATGRLDLTAVKLRNNHASRGGGLYADGGSDGLSIYLHHDTDIFQNIADRTGGGVRIQGSTKLFMLEGGHISNNEAKSSDPDGAGGGIQIVGPAQADLGSAEVSFNTAKIGGGISVNDSAGQYGRLQFFASLPRQPTLIQNNTATGNGGGIYISGGGDDGASSVACGSGFSINSNVASDGAAIYVDKFHSGGQLYVGTGALLGQCNLPSDPARCAVGAPCNAIDGNRAEANGNPSGGSTVALQGSTRYDIEQVAIRGNRGAHVIRASGTAAPGTLGGLLIVQNVVSGDLVRGEEGVLQMNASTIAGNTIGGVNVFSLASNLVLTRSLVWQPEKAVVGRDAGTLLRVNDVLANEVASLGGGAADVRAADPQFRDSGHGDYHLYPTSPALDFAAYSDGYDLDGQFRTIDLTAVANRPGGGPLDLGVFELQGISVFPPDERFDGVQSPSLPPLWVNDLTGAGQGWITSGEQWLSAPNVAFTDDTASITDKSLVSPAVTIVKNGRLRFVHKMDIESQGDFFARDGVVLEISIGGGAFEDISRAGGRFLAGAPVHVIHPSSTGGNPLKGRGVWSGTAGGSFSSVVVDLPSSADGQSIRLRWRMGTDNANDAPHAGYFLDDIHIDVSENLFCDNFETGFGCPR